MKVQLVVPKHEIGTLTDNARNPPQIGPLILASYLKKYDPSLEVEVYDENISAHRVKVSDLDGDIIGLSTWFSNYNSAIRLAQQIKEINAKTRIVLGGPNVTGIEKRILENQNSVDFVVTSDGEEPLRMLVEGRDPKDIPNLTYRNKEEIKSNPISSGGDLSNLPLFDLSLLKTPYQWQGDSALMSAFPLSGLRGCFRKKRCDWCSISTCGVRTTPAKQFWEQVKLLRNRYGINSFYESGDTLLPEFAHELAVNKPEDVPKDVKIRAYGHVGFIDQKYIDDLKKCGINNLFFGVESTVIQGTKYSPERMQRDFQLLRENNMTILPAMILGLPEQNVKSLRADLSLLSGLLEDNSFAPVCLLNTPYPFSGSNYFQRCLEDKSVRERYQRETGKDLLKTDVLNMPLLSRIFVDTFTSVGYDRVQKEVLEFIKKHPKKVSYWLGHE
jgi:hypothetical protein